MLSLVGSLSLSLSLSLGLSLSLLILISCMMMAMASSHLHTFLSSSFSSSSSFSTPRAFSPSLLHISSSSSPSAKQITRRLVSLQGRKKKHISLSLSLLHGLHIFFLLFCVVCIFFFLDAKPCASKYMLSEKQCMHKWKEGRSIREP